MLGKMMQRPLLISGLIEHAQNNHSDTEIVSRRTEGGIHRYTLGEAAKRSQQLAHALTRLGAKKGDCIASLAWNNYRHFELYYGISGIGSVMHTVNPKLFPEQLVYIINHAQDRWIFVDLTFIPLLENIADELQTLEGIIVLCDKSHMPDSRLKNLICYETLIADESDIFDWPEFDDNTAASLCYTSGTTGNPKGVLYSHRSTVLHAQSSATKDVLDIGNNSCILPVVPMFHVNAWGTPYNVAITGAKLVLPGPGLDGASLWELIEAEEPELLLGVPTVWLMLLDYMKSIDKSLTSVTNVVVGGSAAPLSMIKRFQEDHDAFLIHAWGMTEMSPIGTLNTNNKIMQNLPLNERYELQLKQGRPVYGVELKIVDEDNRVLPNDGKAFGRLLVRGPWIASGYYKLDHCEDFIDGWFDTGDVANIDANNYLHIVDRSKDVIKSGGEWISSIDLENVAVGCPGLSECCVIGVSHEKWAERPLLLATKDVDSQISEQDVYNYLSDKIAKWWTPDAIIFVDELPHTATGKLLKVNLREQYKNHLLTLA